MPLSLSVFSQSGPPICTPIWAFFRAFKALRALKGPLIKFSHILMHRPYRDILNLKFSCLYLFPFSHKVVPQKASGGGGGSGGSYTTLQLVNIRVVATTPRKDPQPNISDLRDHSQSIFRPILTRIPKKKKKKKLPPLYIDQLKCGIRPPPPPDPTPDPPTLFGGPLYERTERGRDMKISGLVNLDTADALK